MVREGECQLASAQHSVTSHRKGARDDRSPKSATAHSTAGAESEQRRHAWPKASIFVARLPLPSGRCKGTPRLESELGTSRFSGRSHMLQRMGQICNALANDTVIPSATVAVAFSQNVASEAIQAWDCVPLERLIAVPHAQSSSIEVPNQ